MVDVVVYGKPNCPWCDRAKDLLDHKGITYEYIDVTLSDAAMDKLKRLNIRTVPAIFLKAQDEVYMGGYSELADYVRKSGSDYGIQ